MAATAPANTTRKRGTRCHLTLGSGLTLPLDAVTRASCITGQRGTGKTSSGVVLVEEGAAVGAPSVIIDPTDVWWGLRSSADGRGPGLGHIIFGGEHGHLPLRADTGAVMARLVVEQRLSAVFSLKHLRKGAQVRFVCEFLEELYHLNREALLVVIDEAHRFAPQNLREHEKGGYGARCLGAVVDIASLGRVNGIGVALVTQRLARLHTDAREACEIMTIHRLLGPNDRKAVAEWLRDAGEEDEAADLGRKLPRLKLGQALVYAPDLEILGQYVIRPKRTFDSSGTPEVGAAKLEPKSVADVDLSAIEAMIGETIERAKEEDPRELRARIKGLETRVTGLMRELEQARSIPAPEPEPVPYVPDEFRALAEEGERALAVLEDASGMLAGCAQGIKTKLAATAAASLAGRPGRPAAPPSHPAAVRHQPPAAPVSPPSAPVRDRRTPQPAAGIPHDGNVKLSKAERSIMTVLAQFPGGRSKVQLAILAGYSSKGGGYRNALGRLRSLGFANHGDPIMATDAGLAALGDDWEPLPTGRALVDYWYGNVSKAERAILEALVYVWPHGLEKDELAATAGYEPGGGGFRNALGRLRTLELISGSRVTPIRVDDLLGEERRR